jgi:hypothetical protein
VNLGTDDLDAFDPNLSKRWKETKEFFARQANGRYVHDVFWDPLAFSSKNSFHLANEEKKRELLSVMKILQANEILDALAEK